jgi:predicted AAA+ superfamily ATPase
MQNLELIKEIILDNQESHFFTGTERETELPVINGKATVCIGVRRCGKSTLMYQKIELIKKDLPKENILFLNFFDDRLMELRNGKLHLAIDAYFALYPDKKNQKIYCFFDELQECANWEPFVDRLLRTENAEVYITGSSAKLLSTEIATQMRGRAITVELFPFSFSEYLNFNAVTYKKFTSETRYNLEHWFEKYFETGGYPEVYNSDSKNRVKIHQEYFKTILHRDIIERFDSLHPKATMQLAYRLLTSCSSLITLNRATEFLKSMGFKVSKEFVSNCIDWFEDAYFLFTVKKYDKSFSKQNLNPKKVYCIDHALVTSVSTGIAEKKGYLLENMVFLHLRRKTDEIYYYKTRPGNEVDFYWLDEKHTPHLVQVTWDIEDESTGKREIRALIQAMDETGITTATLVSRNHSDTIEKDGNTINVVPAWRYLLK